MVDLKNLVKVRLSSTALLSQSAQQQVVCPAFEMNITFKTNVVIIDLV